MSVRIARVGQPARIGETIVRVDRATVLGNPFPMHGDEKLRDSVCEAYRVWFEKAVHDNVEVQQTLGHIKNIKGDIVLQCWCAPKRCHAETIKAYLEQQAMQHVEIVEPKFEIHPVFRVAIVGGREFNDYEALKRKCDSCLSCRIVAHKIVIVCGGARGADLLGKRYALERGFDVETYPAYWDTYGKSAGYKRNMEMAHVSDAVIAFWDGESRGTKHMIGISKASGKKVIIARY